MTTVRSSLPHTDRTASEPREDRLEAVIISNIRQVNDNIRLLKLSAVNPAHTIKFLPGQWIDTFIPGLPKAGGFTITSTPFDAKPSRGVAPYLELAVQKSSNPPVQWLWQPEGNILGTQLAVRVGGSFVWPSSTLQVQRLVLVAGGVGVNPLISIFSHVIRSPIRPQEIHFVYGTKAESELDPQRVLFLPRLMDLVAAAADLDITLSLFLTGTGDAGRVEHGRFPNRTFARRMLKEDLSEAIDGYKGDKHGRQQTLCYVCGPQVMTDTFVEYLSREDGMSEDRVLCEKWW